MPFDTHPKTDMTVSLESSASRRVSCWKDMSRDVVKKGPPEDEAVLRDPRQSHKAKSTQQLKWALATDIPALWFLLLSDASNRVFRARFNILGS